MFGFPRPLTFPEPQKYQDGEGIRYAQEIAIKAQRHSFRLVVAGWILIIFAGVFALLGTTARIQFQTIPTTDSALESGIAPWFNANKGVVFGLCAVVVAGLGWQFLDRSSDASLLGAAATLAIGRSSTADLATADKRAYKLCVEAKAAWLEGRMNHDRIAAIARSFFPDPPPGSQSGQENTDAPDDNKNGK